MGRVWSKVKTGLARIPVKRRYCPFCEKNALYFQSFGHQEAVFDSVKIIGGGLRPNCTCPNCRSRDRFRWTWYVLSNYTDILQGQCSVLHIAPEPQIAKKIKQINPACDYVTGDKEKGRADHVLDVTELSFPDNRFDYVIMNHVLEHIPEEARALNEIRRVLKPNGKFVLSMPLAADRETFEDSNVSTPAARLKAYGQEDHCRVYGVDAAAHLSAFGFEMKRYVPENCAAPDLIRKWGLIPQDVIFIGRTTKTQ